MTDIETHVLRRLRREQIARAIGAFLLLLALAISAWNSGPGSCRQRAAGREDVRDAIQAGVDEVGAYASLDDEERAALTGRVAVRVNGELPDPDCSLLG